MSKSTPKMPGEGGSYVRDAKGGLSCKASTKPAKLNQKPPADAKAPADEKEV